MCEACSLDAGVRDDDTVVLSLTLHDGRSSATIVKCSFGRREGAVIGAFIRKIMTEAQCQTPDE